MGLTTPDAREENGRYTMEGEDEHEINDDETTNTSGNHNAGKHWTNPDRRKIHRLLVEDKSWEEITKLLGRATANAVKLEWANMCEKRELVEIVTTDEIPSITPKPDPDIPERNFGKEPGEIYDVVRRRDSAIWYSFKLAN